MRRLLTVLFFAVVGGAGCLPGLELVVAELNTQVTVTGTERGDLVIVKLPVASYTQRESDDDRTVQFDLAAPMSAQRGRVLLRRDERLSCAELVLPAIVGDARRSLSLDVAELGACDDVPVLPGDLLSVTEQRRVPGCEFGPSCVERTAVRRNGVVEVERGEQVSVAILDDASVLVLFDAASTDALNQLFANGCANASDGDHRLLRERTVPGAPQMRVVDELATEGCDPAALTTLQDAFVNARQVVNTSADAGTPVDAGDLDDAGFDAGPFPIDAGTDDGGAPPDDAGAPSDAGPPPDDAGLDDGGLDDAGLPVFAVCGDGQPEGGEACDEGAANSWDPGALCRPDCRLPTCGDGVVDPGLGEACDDGAQDEGDGCDASCGLEASYVCAGAPSICALTAETVDLTGCADGDCVRAGVEQAHQDSGVVLVILGAGVWDMPTKIDLNEAGAVTVVGAGREETVLVNSYTGNGEALKLNHDEANGSFRHLTLSRANNTANVVRLQKGALALYDVAVGPSEGGNGLFVEAGGTLGARAVLVHNTGLGLNVKDGAVVSLDGMVVVDNAAGGALLDSNSGVEVVNSVFVRNSGSSFGGLYLKRPPTIFAFNTVVANTSPSDPSAIRCENAGTVIEATLVGDNPSGIDDEISDECTLVGSAYPSVDEGADDEPPIAACQVEDAASDVFGLPPGSPCRDALPLAFPLPDGADADATGSPRPVGPGTDIGAFESP